MYEDSVALQHRTMNHQLRAKVCCGTYVELLDVGSPRLGGGDHLDAHDLDRVRPGAVTSSHVPV